MTTRKAGFSIDEARAIADAIGIDLTTAPFTLEEFRSGLDVELRARPPRPGDERHR